jgi:gas vesicle protein
VSRRNQQEIVLVERDSSSPLWWLVIGGALGAGLALLFAPEPGTKTRRLLARRLARLRSSAEDLLGEFREAADSEDVEEDEDDEEEETIEAEEEEDLDDEDEDGDAADEEEAEEEPPPNARAELEKRLAAARARRQRELAEDEEPVA